MKPTNYYVADLGNTRIKIAQILDDTEIAEIKSIPNYEFLQNPTIDTSFSDVIVFASVNKNVTKALREKNTELKIYEIGQEIEIPIKNLTDKPEQTGIDRLINCWWAYNYHKKPVIVIDSGTAITIDFCNEQGEFEGGVIMAGTELQLRALNTFTTALPSVKYDEKININAVGKTTEEAMLASVKFGIPGQIKACIDEIIENSKRKPMIFLTGGNSTILCDQLNKIMHKKYKFFGNKEIQIIKNLSLSAIHKIASKFFDQNV